MSGKNNNKLDSKNGSENLEQIVLNEKQLKLFKLLKLKSASSSNTWLSKEDMAKELRLTEANVNTILNSLKKIPGMEILADKNPSGQMRYAISPLILDKTVVGKDYKNTFDNYCALYLAEPAFGTKVFDDNYTMKGLALFLKANGYADKISQVIIQGGVIPHVPPFSSKGYDNDLKFLGQIPRIDSTKSYSEEWLEEKIDNKFERKHYNEYINNSYKRKIVNLTDAFYAAGLQIETLMKVFPENTRLRIQSGEEDRKNIGHIESAYVSAWAKEKETQIEQDREDAEQALELLREANQEYIIKKDAVDKIATDPSFLRNKKEKRKDYITRITNKLGSIKTGSRNKLQNDPLYSVYIDTAKLIYNIVKSSDVSLAISENSLELETAINKNYSKIGLNESLIESLNDTAKWTEQLMGGGRMSSVTWFTRHYPIFASELELIFKKAKDHYTAHFYNWPIEQHVNFHVSSRKQKIVDTGVITDIETGQKDKALIEYDDLSTNKKIISMIHNLNSSFSDNTGAANIRDAKLKSNYINMVLQKFYSDIETLQQPDIMLLGGHGLGGFRVMPWFKKSEHLINGEFVKNQDVAYLIDLPTLQSVPELEKIIGKISNNHTKRYEKGPYGSAAIIHTENSDKVNSFTVIDTAKLIEFGKLASEIETYEKYINNEEVTDEVKLQLQNIVKENYKKIEAAGDMHIGDADNMDRYSKYQLIKASQIYQEKNGLPNILSYDEILHGTESRVFASASRYEAKTPEQFQALVIDPILRNPNMSAEEKLDKIARESLINHRGITIHNGALQLREAKRILEPYVNKVLENNGKVIFMSGNHYNKSTRESDEATQLATALCALKYVDGNQVYEFNGNGNDVGLGTMHLEGDKKLFAMHRFPVNQDEIYGMMKHLRSMNSDVDIAIAGDRHQPGAGYADGHLVVLHPGYETINKFVPLIGKPAGLRGFNNIYYDVMHKGIYKVDFIVNPTLEKIVEENNIM
ncbi:MAG: hypothetical protein ACP5N1_03100 [Candidatus Woesearchaeota archaeon]